MNIFGKQFEDGPGVYEDIDRMNSFGLFIFLIKEKFFKLVALNLVFVLCLIPIITIGPAIKGLSKVTMDMVRGKPTSPIPDFFDEFKKDFLKTAIYGILLTLLIIFMIFSIVFYVGIAEGNIIYYVIAGVTFLALIYILAIIMLTVKSMAYIKLSLKNAIRNAALLVVISPLQMITLLLIILLPTYFLVTRMAIGFPCFLIWQFSINSLISSIVAYKILNKHIKKSIT